MKTEKCGAKRGSGWKEKANGGELNGSLH